MAFETGLDIGDVAAVLSTVNYQNFLPKVLEAGLDLGALDYALSTSNYVTPPVGGFSSSVDLGDCPLPFTTGLASAYVSGGSKVFTGSLRTIMSSLPSKSGDDGIEVVLGLILVADFTPSLYRGGAPLQVDFEDISYTSHAYEDVTEINAWAWDFGDGNTSTEQDPSHTFAIMGEYDVTLVITTTDGRTAHVTKTIIVAYITSYRFGIVETDDLFAMDPAIAAAEQEVEFGKESDYEPVYEEMREDLPGDNESGGIEWQ